MPHGTEQSASQGWLKLFIRKIMKYNEMVILSHYILRLVVNLRQNWNNNSVDKIIFF